MQCRVGKAPAKTINEMPVIRPTVDHKYVVK